MELDFEKERDIIISLNCLGEFLNKKYNNKEIKEQINNMFHSIKQNCIINISNQNSEKEQDIQALNIILSFKDLKNDKEKDEAFQKLLNFCETVNL